MQRDTLLCNGVTRDDISCACGQQRRAFTPAPLVCVPAARVKGAAGGWIEWVRRGTPESHVGNAGTRFGREHGIQQRACVGMPRMVKERTGIARLDDAAEVHHRHSLRDVPHHR
jgi:hypothetical protein